ncbi:hypothetical protein NSU_1419 [Novosphingobium pentaromativorans US6-1]|uniref:Uncharacterized protein n=1 Tax=Novosphingobium pentaromativorans US6-1 TaxID=1088721 RepID=G6EAM1_9SPHN|nr:hypothetical protein NSU_1419 [Novosphingobium pentaromativorans US6-1]
MLGLQHRLHKPEVQILGPVPSGILQKGYHLPRNFYLII